MGKATELSRRRFVGSALSAAALAALPASSMADAKMQKRRNEMTTLTPYLLFDGKCQQAMEFYKSDYAYAAATTGLGNLIDGGTPEQLGSLGLPGITTAYNTTIGSIPHDKIPHSLFVVYGGFNDFISDGLTTATADHAVANLIAIVADLQKRGARWILVPALLDMGMTPYYTSQGAQTAALATSLSKYLNQKLLASLPKRGSVLRYPRPFSGDASPSRRIRANGCGRPML
jgi:hypothetical protein